jgi:hypothetical protein
VTITEFPAVASPNAAVRTKAGQRAKIAAY